jgi:putative membrane protein
MLHLILSWLLAAGALLLAAAVFDRVKLKGDFADALWVSALFAVLSFLLDWFFFVLLGLATLGLGFIFQFLTHLVAAALIVKLTAALSRRFDVSGFFPAVGTALLLALAAEISGRVMAILG